VDAVEVVTRAAENLFPARMQMALSLGWHIPLTVAAIATPVQIGVGDWIANTVAANQPARGSAPEPLPTSMRAAR
jgi:hypothetical protein